MNIYKKSKLKIDEIKKVFLSANLPNDKNIGVLSGKMGVSLFMLYHWFLFKDKDSYEYGCLLMDECVKAISHGEFYSPTFCAGLSGVGFLLHTLKKNKIITFDNTDDIDDYLYEAMLMEINKKNYDYLHGYLGICLYFINKEKTDLKTERAILSIIDALETTSMFDDSCNGLKWVSNFSLANLDKGKYDLSIAHGSAGIILILCKILQLKIDTQRVINMLEKGINYILSQQKVGYMNESKFPYSELNNNINGTRLAWCYGDLGIAIALWQAGKLLNKTIWEELSIDIFTSSTKRLDLTINYVFDAGFCHGTAGICYIFQKMYSETRINNFKTCSEYWLNETLKMAKFSDGLAGYKSYDQGKWNNNYSFLDGIAGIGLVLLSLFSVNNFWDVVVLLS
jgi:lantibiotic modifying enzyme